jgi:hypothetical protein
VLGRNEYRLLRAVPFAGIAGHTVFKVLYEGFTATSHTTPFFLLGCFFTETRFNLTEAPLPLVDGE